MARIVVQYRDTDSVTLYVAELNTGSTYTQVYISLGGRNSPNLARAKGYSTSESWKVTGLSCGTTYNTSYSLLTSAGSTHQPNSDTARTLDCPYVPPYPGSISRVNLSSSLYTPGVVEVSWTSATDADRYAVEIRRTSSGTVVDSSYSVYGTSINFFNLLENMSYTVKVYGINSRGNGLANDYNTIITTSFGVGNMGTVRVSPSPYYAGRIDVSWNAVANAERYAVEVTRHSSGTLVASDYNVYGTTKYFDGMLDNMSYNVKVYGIRSGKPNGGSSSTNVISNDLNPPVVSITSTTAIGMLRIGYSASDAGVGLRNSSTYRTYIGSANGSVNTLGKSEYTNSTLKTWDTDVGGNAFVHNANYWVGVRAYDANGNESNILSTQLQYKSARPLNWGWYASKTKGNKAFVSAEEWNEFTKRINGFRQYKGLGNYTFTNAVRGNIITATIFNQARTAISGMSINTSLPNAAVSGGEMTAYHFNRIAESLNSVS